MIELESRERVRLKQFFTVPHLRYALSISVALHLSQQLSGINGVSLINTLSDPLPKYFHYHLGPVYFLVAEVTFYYMQHDLHLVKYHPLCSYSIILNKHAHTIE